MSVASGSEVGAAEPSYFVYVLHCEDGSLYTGITTDVVRRLCEHLTRSARAARYTRTHPVVALEGLWELSGRSAASRLEWHLHHLSRPGKLALLARPEDVGGGAGVIGASGRKELWERAMARKSQTERCEGWSPCSR